MVHVAYLIQQKNLLLEFLFLHVHLAPQPRGSQIIRHTDVHLARHGAPDDVAPRNSSVVDASGAGAAENVVFGDNSLRRHEAVFNGARKVSQSR